MRIKERKQNYKSRQFIDQTIKQGYLKFQDIYKRKMNQNSNLIKDLFIFPLPILNQ